MFGFIKNLLRKAPEISADNYETTQSESEPMTTPQAAAKPPVFKAPPLRRNGTAANGHAKGIELSLQTVLQGLPLELQPRVKRADVGEATITVPLEKVLAQLSRGAVKVSFGELRQAAPEIFTSQNDRDRVLVSLPLADILSKLNPALIARRRVQRQIEVPAEISSPFDSHGNGLRFGSTKAEAEPPPPASQALPPRQHSSSPPPMVAPPRSALASAPTPPGLHEMPATAPASRVSLNSAPTPVPPGLTPKQAAPPLDPATGVPRNPIAFAPKPIAARPISPIDPTPVAPATPAPVTPTPAGIPVSPLSAPISMIPMAAAPVPPPQPQVVKTAAPVLREPGPVATPQSGPAPAKTPGLEPLVVSLASLAEAWPEEVRKELIGLGLAEAKLALPATAIEQALKQGRICFSWKTIRSWIKPAVPASVSNYDGAVLDLPLKVVAPIFLERQRKAASAKPKVSIDEEIPNLFFGFPQPEGAAPPPAARATDTNYYVWEDTHDTARIQESEVKRGPTPGTKFVAKYATPNEVVSRAAGLEGVAGALIALPDGLMVANRLPPDLNADTLAAFLPQIFGKVSQCTKELRMGDLNNLNFTVGNVPWKIFRVNAIFFAAFGQAGVPLPTAQLAALAAELDHKAK